MASLIVIAEAAVKAYQLHKKQEEQAADAAERKRLVKLIISTIQAAKNEIVDELQELRLQELEGMFTGVLRDFNLYADNSNQENLLVNNVISTANSISGQLETIINDIENRPDFAIRAFTIYANTVSLLLSSLTEWALNHEANTTDSILENLEMARDKSQAVLNVLRKQSDARFSDRAFFLGCIEQCEFGDQRWGYKFEERTIEVYYNDGSSSLPHTTHPNDILAKHKRTAFLDYSIVPNILTFQSLLARDHTRSLLLHRESDEISNFLEVMDSGDFSAQKEFFHSLNFLRK